MNENYEFLAGLPLFDCLTEEEVALLANISREYSFEEGSVIAYQRDVADSLYLVKSGRLYAEQIGKNDSGEDGCVLDSQSYDAGQHFGETWLFESSAHTHTVRGTESGRLLIITQKGFLRFLKENPDVLDGLKPCRDDDGNIVAGLTPEAWEMAERTGIKADKATKSVELMPDELVEFYTRRSKWYLAVKMMLPVIGIFMALSLAVILLSSQFFNGRLAFANLALPTFVFVIPAIFAFIYVLDWRNDYFVITNKHLTHHEFELTKLRSHVNKIPIDKIQSISTIQPTFFANLFGFGTARITTSSQSSSIFFDNIDHPERVIATLERLKAQSQALTAGLIQAAMRNSLEKHFQVTTPYHEISEQKAIADSQTAETARQSFSRSIRKRYGTHLIEEGTITYRKNFFAFLRTVMWPLLVTVPLLFLLFYLLQFYLGAPLIVEAPLFIFIFIVSLFWLYWQIEDWRNDNFQLTDQYVIDIDRKPFGISETRKQAGLGNVQNVTANKPNIWATIWNYGDVHIETAGAVSDIVFEQVSHPNRVQSEIFQRLEQYKQRIKVNEGTQRRQEYAVLMDVYHQATEQNRIPRRTPK